MIKTPPDSYPNPTNILSPSYQIPTKSPSKSHQHPMLIIAGSRWIFRVPEGKPRSPGTALTSAHMLRTGHGLLDATVTADTAHSFPWTVPFLRRRSALCVFVPPRAMPSRIGTGSVRTGCAPQSGPAYDGRTAARRRADAALTCIAYRRAEFGDEHKDVTWMGHDLRAHVARRARPTTRRHGQHAAYASLLCSAFSPPLCTREAASPPRYAPEDRNGLGAHRLRAMVRTGP